MNILYQLVLLVIGLSLVSCQQLLYIFPIELLSNGSCSSNSNESGGGVGYSLFLDYCFTVDGITSHIISNSGDSGNSNSDSDSIDDGTQTFIHNSYKNIEQNTAQCSNNLISSETFESGDCQKPIILSETFSNLSGFNINIYLSVSGDSPFWITTNNSFVNWYSEDVCSYDNAKIVEFFPETSVVQLENEKTVTITCIDGVPTLQDCNSNQQCTPPQDVTESCGSLPNYMFKSTFCTEFQPGL